MFPLVDAFFRARDLVDEHGVEHLQVASAESQDLVFKLMCHVENSFAEHSRQDVRGRPVLGDARGRV